MTIYVVNPICSAIVAPYGRKVTVYDPGWSNDGRFPVVFQDGTCRSFIVSKKRLTPQHIINQELAVQYGFTQGCWLGPHRVPGHATD